MPFERYRRKTPVTDAPPRLAVYPDGAARLNQAATRRWFDIPCRVEIYLDREAKQIALTEAGDDIDDTMAVNDSGEFYLKRPLKQIGIDPDDLEGTQYLSIEEREGLIVADCSELENGAEPTTEPETPTADDVDDAQEELLDPDSLEDLQRAYDEADSIAEAAERFPLNYKTIWQRLVDAGIHSTGNNGSEPVDSFEELTTPDWLDEGSWYQAVDMAADVDELVEVLGWEDRDRVKRAIEQLGLEDEVAVDA